MIQFSFIFYLLLQFFSNVYASDCCICLFSVAVSMANKDISLFNSWPLDEAVIKPATSPHYCCCVIKIDLHLLWNYHKNKSFVRSYLLPAAWPIQQLVHQTDIQVNNKWQTFLTRTVMHLPSCPLITVIIKPVSVAPWPWHPWIQRNCQCVALRLKSAGEK